MNNPHFHNVLLLIGAVLAYNIEGHNDPAWLAVVIVLIFWGWWKDIKVIVVKLALDNVIEEVTQFQEGLKEILSRSKEKNTKK